MNDVSVRRAVAVDLPALERLWAELIDHHAEGDSYFTRSAAAVGLHGARLQEDLDREDRLILLAERDSDPVGFVIAEIRPGPDIFLVGPYGFVRDLGVTRSARRMGVGQQLYEAVLDWFAEHEVGRAELDVTEANEVARRFWSRQGYRRLYARMIVDLADVER
jgi:ribosomal protein S18 acetylase RimI-like enzyme